jgi:hypothetical protein
MSFSQEPHQRGGASQCLSIVTLPSSRDGHIAQAFPAAFCLR